MENKNKKIKSVILLVVIILLILAAFWQGNKYGAKQSQESVLDSNCNGRASDSLYKTLEQANAELDASPVLKDARVEAPDANPILNNVVVTLEGQPTLNSAVPMAPDAPRQTPPISQDQLADSVIRLDMSSSGLNPNRFTVVPGAVVTVAVTSNDEATHLLQFNDPSLYAVRVLVAAGTTRAISFNAPAQPGEYSFRCGVAEHGEETGIMIVK